MPLPTYLSQQLAMSQPLVDSAERSKYSEAQDVWAESSEGEGEQLSTSEQIATFGVKSAAAYLIYNNAPHLAKGAHEILTSTRFQKWAMRTDHDVKTIGDVFKLKTGKTALTNIRAALLGGATDLSASDNYSKTSNFWYSGLTKVQQEGIGLPIFDNVIKLFTKATYLTDVLSYGVDRGKTPINLDISLRSLGEVSRDRTLDFYSKQLGITRQRLSLIDHLVYVDGNVFEGKVDLTGKINAIGNALAGGITLADKGKYTESVLIGIDSSLGLKERTTGATYAEKVGGNEGYVLIGEGELDPSISKLFRGIRTKLNFFNMLDGGENSISNWGPVKFFKQMLGKTAAERSNKLFHAEAYSSYALTRTSDLVTEIFNETGSFLEYLFPNAKKNIYSTLSENNLVPRVAHGHGFAMLGRYSRLATTVGAGLMAINQLGYSMKNGENVEKQVAGVLQTGALAIAGGMIAHKLNKRTLPGVLIGGAVGGLGMLGVGPFSAGPIPGIANLVGRANEIRSYIGEATLVNDWRRSFEEMMPGSTNPTTALGVGIGAGAAFVTLQRFLNKKSIVEVGHRQEYLLRQFQDAPNITLREVAAHIRDTSGRVERVKTSYAERMKHVDEEELEKLHKQMNIDVEATRHESRANFYAQRNIKPTQDLDLAKLSEQQVTKVESDILSYTRSLEESGEHAVLNNPIGKIRDKSNLAALAEKITDFKYEEGRQSILKNERSVFKRVVKAIENAPRVKAISYAAVLGAAGWFLGTGGLGTVEKPHELRELNQGKRLETVRRNQNWEMGQGGYGGDDVLYQRPSLIARLSSGATQAGSSGNRGPLEEFFLKNFTYKLERENYYKRPAPITGAAFDQIPFIYPAIQPIADLIKRPKLMHVGEWKRKSKDGKTKYLERTTGLDEVPDQRLGGIAMAAPLSPYEGSRVLGKFWQEASSLGGLVGFYAKSAKKFLTGTAQIGDQRDELESFSRNMDIDSKFYDLHGGGSFLGIPFTSEVIRRFVHKDESKQYNPIRNQMPSWLPDSFKFGNPYTSARHGEGEYRMPGEGYEALHSELKGMNPEDYPLLHRLNILGDVSPYSPQYKGTLNKAQLMRDSNEMTDKERGFFYRHEQMMKEKKNKREYDSYQFKPSSYDNISGTIASVDPNSLSFTLEGYGGRFGVAGITNNVDALISDFNYSQIKAAKVKRKNEKVFADELKVGQGVTVSVPASIGQAVDDDGIIKAAVRNNGFNVNKELRSEGKFAEESSPIGNFAMTNYLGKAIGAGWEAATHFANRVAQPIEHIMAFGAAPINKLLPYRDALEDYQSRELYGTEMKGWDSPIKDWIAPALKSAAHNWFGIDFQSPGLRKKRDTEEYFDKLKYVKYKGLESAAAYYGEDRLAKQYGNIAQKTVIGSTGFVSDESLGSVLGGRESVFASGFAREFNPGRQEEIIDALPGFKQRTMKSFYLGKDLDAINRAASAGPMSSFGMDYAGSLTNLKENMGYEEANNSGEAISMREKEVSQYFEHKSIPRADWIGFNPAVDLEDVKLKYIESEGMNYHDFGIYPSRASYLSRKPYVDEKSVQDLNDFRFIDPHKAMSSINNLNDVYGNYSYNIQGPNRFDSSISLDIRNNISVNPFE